MAITEQDFRINWATFRDSSAERADWLRHELAILDRRYNLLLGFGQRFQLWANMVCCPEQIDLSHKGIAHYEHYSQEGWIGNVIYGLQALASRDQLFSSRNHELVHAFQYHAVPALHLMLYNFNTTTVLSPRSFVWLNNLTERDAYAKEILLNEYWRYVEKNMTENSISSDVASVQGAANINVSLNQSFARAAQYCMQEKTPMSPSWLGRFRENVQSYYILKALHTYETTMHWRKDDIAAGRLTFVRLEEEDVLSVGSSLGVNTFGPQNDLFPEYRVPTAIPLSMQLRLKMLNHHLGIGKEDRLPPIGAVVDRAAFLQSCHARREAGLTAAAATDVPAPLIL